MIAALLTVSGCGSDDGFGPAYDPMATGDASVGASSAGEDTSQDPASTGGSSRVDEGSSTSGAASTDEGTTGEPNECPRVRVVVAAGETLNVRPMPSTAQAPIGSLANNAIVDVIEQVEGESIDGTTLWFHIANDMLDGYVFGGLVECTFDEPPDLSPPDGFWLPLECGTTATISQGNDGGFSHQGNAFYAFDFSLGVGTPMVAMAQGIVIHTFSDTMPGDPCYNGGGPECFPYGNLVVLYHGDGSTSLYKHLSVVLVSDGELVPRGTTLGLSGSTGYSTGPHAHVMRQEDCGEPNCQSIPLEFVEAGVPVTGESVTSENCP